MGSCRVAKSKRRRSPSKVAKNNFGNRNLCKTVLYEAIYRPSGAITNATRHKLQRAARPSAEERKGLKTGFTKTSSLATSSWAKTEDPPV
jgi:hypothetical protein